MAIDSDNRRPADAVATEDAEAHARRRSWRFIAAAGVTGAIAATLFVASSVAPASAPYLAALAIFVGVAIGALLNRRAIASEILSAMPQDDETAADRQWQLRDIAEHYRSNTDQRRRAEAASAAKSQFLATVSHEIRTPLSGVLGLANVLLETPLTTEQETFAEAIRTSGELMLGLVDDMLDFAKIEAGRFDLAPEPTELEPYLDSIAELFSSRADAKGLDLSTYVDPAAPAQILVDPGRLRQVMFNLIANALKFTDSGGVAVEIFSDADRPGSLSFAVSDTGNGVPAGAMDVIFEEFERAEGHRHHSGSGLGLAIAGRIVGRMGSRIEVADRPGGGSVFSFALPVGAADAVAEPVKPALAGKRALILAPSGLAPQLLARVLSDNGATAQYAANISQAAALAGAAAAAAEAYDFALLDQRLIGENAMALATVREAAGATLPAVLLIQAGRRQTKDEMEGLGFNAYLVRPIRRRSLTRIVERLVSGDQAFGADPGDQPNRPSSSVSQGSGMTVLLAEDDQIHALLLRAMLLKQGHELVEVNDGAAAVEAAKSRDFDAILLDIHLPVMSGLDAARKIRSVERQRNKAPATMVAVSADARPESREEAIASGFDQFLAKPMTPATLRDLLGKQSEAA